jgi:hypothetical protein
VHIQRGNAASLANARRWATWTSAPAITALVPMRRRPARGSTGVVRAAGPGDLESIAAELERFSGRSTFARPWPVTELGHWLRGSPFDDPVNHVVVAVDGRGQVLAGFGLTPRRGRERVAG